MDVEPDNQPPPPLPQAEPHLCSLSSSSPAIVSPRQKQNDNVNNASSNSDDDESPDDEVERLRDEWESLNTMSRTRSSRLDSSNVSNDLSDDDEQQRQPCALTLSGDDCALRHKNRYHNILPNEHTRVHLAGENNYINANFIDGVVRGSARQFIATQAPLDSTLEDFWRMCWEQRVGTIVMLTPLVDRRGRHRADCYWPTDSGAPRQFGRFVVSLISQLRVGGGIIVRRMRVCRVDLADETARDIVQLHYYDWPDFGTTSTSAVLRLWTLVTFTNRQSTLHGLDGPTLVHCSAGVGRAGTFIAIAIGLGVIEAGGEPDVFQMVLKLRSQRRGMVQTLHQYAFIQHVLREQLTRHRVAKSMPPRSAPVSFDSNDKSTSGNRTGDIDCNDTIIPNATAMDNTNNNDRAGTNTVPLVPSISNVPLSLSTSPPPLWSSNSTNGVYVAHSARRRRLISPVGLFPVVRLSRSTSITSPPSGSIGFRSHVSPLRSSLAQSSPLL